MTTTQNRKKNNRDIQNQDNENNPHGKIQIDTTKKTMQRMEIYRNKKNQSELQIKLVSCGQFIGFDDPDRFIDYINHLLTSYEFADVEEAIKLWVVNSDFRSLGLDYVSSLK